MLYEWLEIMCRLLFILYVGLNSIRSMCNFFFCVSKFPFMLFYKYVELFIGGIPGCFHPSLA